VNATTPDTEPARLLRMAPWLQSHRGHAPCDEAVVRRGEEQPCEKPAVAMRWDTRDYPPSPYPVCARHSRAPMVTLADLLDAASGAAK
jgi:hypothetical protein